MIAVRCPQITTGRGMRLVSERRIRGLQAVQDGWLLTVACPCGQEHAVTVRRDAPLASGAAAAA